MEAEAGEDVEFGGGAGGVGGVAVLVLLLLLLLLGVDVVVRMVGMEMPSHGRG